SAMATNTESTSTIGTSASPRWAYWACLALVLIAVFAFAPFLDRYPEPYVDEPYFNYAAVRYLEGKGLNYRVSPNAPYGDTLWAYHGPFYPVMQVATFAALGV